MPMPGFSRFSAFACTLSSWDNAASLALARNLRLIPYADTLALA